MLKNNAAIKVPPVPTQENKVEISQNHPLFTIPVQEKKCLHCEEKDALISSQRETLESHKETLAAQKETLQALKNDLKSKDRIIQAFDEALGQAKARFEEVGVAASKRKLG
jgi:hypothetical protein